MTPEDEKNIPAFKFMTMLADVFGDSEVKRDIRVQVYQAKTELDLDALEATLSDDLKQDKDIAHLLYSRRQFIKTGDSSQNPLQPFVEDIIRNWQGHVSSLSAGITPENAPAAVAEITTYAVEAFVAAATIDFVLGALPNGEGYASSNTTKHLLTSLGLGAVLAATAHDPVKIGLLRPYQDSLEQTFRNRRPDDNMLFQAYRTRELSPAKIADLSALDEAEMNRIEDENDRIYFTEISKWGYSEEFARALSRSATYTLRFNELNAAARLGLLNEGEIIYNLWGAGYDRAVMPGLIRLLKAQNEIANYEGFRSQVEPSFTAGYIEESDLVAYWDKIHVPKDIQAWVLPRLRAARDKTVAAARGVKTQAQKDLTTSQIQQAYMATLIDRATAVSWLGQIGYDSVEVEMLLKLAEMSKKSPAGTTLKRLPLTDYEKLYKNKLIDLQAVLDRMKGEYLPFDIEMEKMLLEAGKA